MSNTRKYKASRTFIRCSAAALLTSVMSLFAVMSAFATGGDLNWSYNVAKLGKQEVIAAAYDAQGAAVLVGLDGSTNSDWLVTKVHPDGSGVAWAASYDFGNDSVGTDSAMSVVTDSDKNVVVAGYVYNGNDFDIQVIKYDGNGDGSGNPLIIWQHTYDAGHGADEYATSIALDSDDNVFVGGYGQDLSGKDDFIILRYTKDDKYPDDPAPFINEPQWVQTWNGPGNGHDVLQALAVGSGTVAAVGKTQNATPDYDLVTVAFDSTTKQLVGSPMIHADSGDGEGRDVAIDSLGNVVSTGFVFNGSYRDLYLASFKPDMSAENWSKIVDHGNDDEGYAVYIDDDKEVYVTGSSYSVTNRKDVFTARYRATDGVQMWEHRYNSENGDNDIGRDIWVDFNGEVYVTGYDDNYDSGFDDVLVLKLRKDASTGTLLWAKKFDGFSNNDRGVSIGPGVRNITDNSLEQLLVAGWSDRWTSDATDYEFQLLSFEPGTINSPTDLDATTVSDTAIDLVWTDNSNSEKGYIVERKICNVGTFEIITDPALGINVEAYSDTGLTADTHYCYRVKAVNDELGDSPYSNEDDAITTVINPDPPSWLFSYEGSENGADVPASIAVGPDHDPVVTGTVYGGDTGYDYHTIKLNRTNHVERWSATYDDPSYQSDFATSVAIDSNNQVIVTGYASLWGGGGGNTNDIYTLWYPSSGGASTNANQYNGPSGSDDRSASVAVSVDANNNSAVVGYGKNAQFDDDLYLLKYNQDGERQWAITPFDNGGNDYPESVAFDPAGDIFVVGSTENAGNTDWFVAKYNGGDGSLAWAAPDIFAGPGGGDDEAFEVAVDSAGDAYVTGYITNIDGNRDWYTIKYDGATATKLWEKPLNGPASLDDEAASVVIDILDGTICVAGTVTTASGNRDYALRRYNANGDVVWSRTYNAPASDEQLYAADIDLNGSVTLIGVSTTGINEDMLSVKYDWNGIVIGVSHYDANGADDGAIDVAVNRYGEAFVTGYITNASDNMDYAVFMAEGETLQSVYPLSGAAYLNHADLTWVDNNLYEDYYEIERKAQSCSSTGSSWVLVDILPAGSNTITDNGIDTDRDYCYRVRATDDSGRASQWLEIDLNTSTPTAPSGLTATTTSTTSIKLDWTDNTIGESGFYLERCQGASCDHDVDPVELIEIDPHDGTGAVSFTDDTTCPGTTYRYRIQAYRADTWWTAWDYESDSPVTDSATPPVLDSVTRISEIQLRLDWTPQTADHTGFVIEKCQIGGSCENINVGASLNYRIDSVTAGKTYKYRVSAIKNAAPCGWPTGFSNEITREATIVPPDGIVLTPIDTTTLKIDWNDNTVSNTSFVVESCYNSLAVCCPGGTCNDLSFSELGTTTGNVKTLTDTEKCEGSTNTYRIKASHSSWDSDWSTAIEETMPDAVSPPLTVTPINESEMLINWDSSTSDADTYTLKRCTGDATTCASGPFTTVSSGGPVSGLQLHYKMDQSSWGAGAIDSSGYNRTGTVYGNTSLGSGYFNNASYHDGSGDYIISPLNIHQGSTSPGATFAAWVYPTSNAGYRYVVSTDNGGIDWSLYSYGTSWSFTDGTGYRTGPSNSVELNTWQHLAVVFEPGVGTRLYKNGVLILSNTGISYDSSDANVTIGRRGTYTSTSYHYSGRIDDVQVYSEPLDVGAIDYVMRQGMVDGGLAPDTTYTYKLSASKTADCPWGPVDGALVAKKTDAIVPPPGFQANAVTTTSIKADWNDIYGSESRFKLQRCDGDQATCCPNVVCNDLAADAMFTSTWYPAANSETYTNSNVCSNNTYTYRLLAEKTSGTQWQSDWSVDTVSTNAPTTPNLSVGSYDDSEVVLNWSNSNSDATHVRVLRCDTGPSCTPTDVITTLTGAATTYTDTTVSSWNYYRYQVIEDRNVTCAWHMPSNIVDVDLNLATPEPLEAEYVTMGSVDLKWADPYANEDQYRLQDCPGTLATCDQDTKFTDVTLPSADVTRHRDIALCIEDPTHTYRIRAESSAWSQSTDWATLEVSQNILPPSNFTADSPFETEVDLAWSDSNLGGDQFLLKRCQGDATACNDSATWYNVAVFPRSPAGQVMELRMDEYAWHDTAGDVVDTSGSNRTATPFGGITTTADGYFERAGVFDGAANDYISTDLTLDQTETGPGVTFSAFVNTNVSSTAYQQIIGTNNSTDYDWGFGIADGRWFLFNGYQTLLSPEFFSVPAAPNNWYHVVCTFEPGVGVKLYVNGTPVITSASISYPDSGAVTIGRRGTYAGYYFNGMIDEVNVFASVLDAADVDSLYQTYQAKQITDQGLSPATTYTYRVYEEALAVNGQCGWLSPPAIKTVTTRTPPGVANFNATTLDTTTINLDWDDLTISETSFRLQRCDNDLSTCCPDLVCDENDDTNFSGWDKSLPLGADTGALSHTDTTLCNDGQYTYRIRPENEVWDAMPDWEVAGASTPGLTPPANLQAKVLSESEVNLTWDSRSADETGFPLEICVGDATACNESTGTFDPVDDLPPSAPGQPVLHYRMNEEIWTGAAAEVFDSSGNSNDGQTFNGLTTAASGKYGRGGSFDGVNDYLRTPLNLDQSGSSGGMTFEAWIYPTIANLGDIRYVFSTDAVSTNNFFGLDLGTEEVCGYGCVTNNFFYVSTGNARVSTDVSFTLNQWQHVAVVYEPGVGIKLYLNGAYENTIPIGAATTSDVNLVIGRHGNVSAGYFAGFMDEVVVLDRAYDAATILAHYQSLFKGIDTVDTGLEPGTTYTWRTRAEKALDPVEECGWETGNVYVTAMTNPPPPPNGLKILRYMSNRIDIAWNDTTSSETGFVLNRCEGAICEEINIPANQEIHHDYDVCAGRTYDYSIKSVGAGWSSVYSPEVQTSTTTPSALGALSLTAVNEAEVRVEWDDTNPDETHYIVERCDDELANCNDVDFVAQTNYSEIADGALLHYRLDETVIDGTARELFDISLNHHEGTTHNGATSVAGKYGQAVQFDGVDDYVSTPLVTDQTETGPGLTMEAWVYPTKSSGASLISVLSTDNGGNDWGFGHYYDRWAVSTGNSVQLSYSYLTLNEWHHVAVTFKPGENYRLYVNGVEVDVKVMQSTFYDGSTGTLNIGSQGGSAGFFGGSVDEVAVYEGVLSAEEIASHYANQLYKKYDVIEGGLVGSNTYTYRLRAVAANSPDCGWPLLGSPVQVTTLMPPAPTSAEIVSIDTNDLVLGWTDNTGSEEGFTVWRCEGDTCDFTGSYDEFSIEPNVESFVDNTGCNGDDYSYKIRADKPTDTSDPAIWPSDWSNVVAGGKPQLVAPTGLIATKVSATEVALDWNDNSSDDVGFVIERCLAENCSSFTQVGSVDDATTHFQDAGLEAGVGYLYRVRAVKNWPTCANEGGLSETVGFLSEATGQITLTAVPVNSRMARLDWNDLFSGESGYEIEIKIWNGQFVHVATVGENVLTYTDSWNLEPLKTYTYRIRPYVYGNYEAYSNEADVEMPVYNGLDTTCK